MMGIIQIKNQKQNLFSAYQLKNQKLPTYGSKYDANPLPQLNIIDDFSFSYWGNGGWQRAYLPLKAGVYTLYFEVEGSIQIRTDPNPAVDILGIYKYQTVKILINKTSNFDLWFYVAAPSNDSGNRFGTLKNIVLLEGDYIDRDDAFFKEFVKLSYIEFDDELYGFGGWYDQVLSDGKILRYWQRETGISVTSGAGTVSQSGTGTCILVNESNGEVYFGTVSGVSISSSAAPDGTYTVIYRLSTPKIETLDYNGELALSPGTNYIVLPDNATASISGNRKYLEG